MQAATQERTQTDAPRAAESKGEVARFQPPRLPYHPAIEERFGVKAAEWKALVEAVFPLAQTVDSVVLALSYCKARKLDPFKRVVHIVPIWDKNYVAPSGKKGRMVDTIWPGIGELRTTAFRTKQYAGADACEFGPMVEHVFTSQNDNGERRNVGVKFPEWAQLTVYRLIDGQRVPIPGPRVHWLETYSRMGRTEIPNDMWQKRPIGQLEKCAEAAALRRAFPEELGDEPTADEAGALHIGPENAKDVTPRPAREEYREEAQQAAEEAAEPFDLTTSDGEARTFDSAADAIAAMEKELRAAAKIGRDALDGLWETNGLLLTQLRERGHADIADELKGLYTELSAEAGAAATRKTAETKPAAPAPEPVKAAAPEPPSPLKNKRAEWAPRVEWLKAKLKTMSGAERAEYLSTEPDFGFIEKERTPDWQAIEQLCDELADTERG